MTSDSQGAQRGYGPSSSEAEPTVRIPPGGGPDASAGFDRYGLPVPPEGAADRFGAASDQHGLDPVPASGAPGRYGPPDPIPGTPDRYGLDPASGAPDHNGLDPMSGRPDRSGSSPASGAPDQYGLAPGGPDRFGPSPTSGAPDQYGLAPGGPDRFGSSPNSGAPDRYGLDPTSGGPDRFGSSPTSGAPDRYGLAPTSGGPDRFGVDPVSGGDPLAFNRGPRIEPSPPPQRNRLVIGLIAGLLAGLVLFGAGGFFLGKNTSSQAAPAPAPSAEPSAVPSLGVYEQSQVAINQGKLTGALAPMSQAWLPYLSSCTRNGDPGGPTLNNGEKTRARCRFDGMSLIFVEYTSVTERDKARVKTLSQNVDARTLTPGVGAAAEKAGPSGRTNGNYVEYAYTVTENKIKLTVAGIWWDDTQTPVAAYMLAYWKDGVGESWAPMREVWARYA